MLRSKDALVLAGLADGQLVEWGNSIQLSMQGEGALPTDGVFLQGEGALPTNDGLSSHVQTRFADAARLQVLMA